MGRYHYTANEKAMNKVLKYQQDELSEMERQLSSMRDSGEARISESEEVLRSLGYSPQRPKALPIEHQRATPIAVTESWDEILRQAEKQYPFDVEFEDLLTREEFQIAYHDLDNINREFRQKTTLNGTDAAFVMVAAALQTLRWILINFIDGKVSNVTRLTDKQGEDLVKAKKKEFLEKHNDWSATKEQKGRRLRQEEGRTWKEIVFMKPVPYDVMEGSSDPALKLGLGGTTHRYKTPGHDPILGWFFGTMDILSYVITLNNLISYRIEKIKNRPTIIPGSILLPKVIWEAVEQVRGDKYKLPAAIFRQAAHFRQSQHISYYTKPP